MAVDPRFGNSSGYFKDPISGEDLSPDTPRAVPCSFENGKFTWPCVMQSDGEQLLKIVYKYFTDEEKNLYKQYRGRNTGESKPRTRSPSSKKEESEPVVEVEQEQEEHIIKYDEESAVSIETLTKLAECDACYGISFISGITYVLCGKRGSGVKYHIPRACVPDSEFERLCEGVNYDC